MPNFTFLSSYNNYGVYNNINKDEYNNNINQNLSSEFINEITDKLSEGSKITDKHPDWIKKSDIITKGECELSLTYINESAGYNNALSYYVYDLDDPPTRFNDIEDIYIVFPNASNLNSGGELKSGDTMKLVYKVLDYTIYKIRDMQVLLNLHFQKIKG